MVELYQKSSERARRSRGSWLRAAPTLAPFFLFPTPLSCTCSAEEIDCWRLFNQRQELILRYPPPRRT